MKTIRKFTAHLADGGKLPIITDSIVEIGLDNYSSDRDGNVFLTPHLMTEGEIDWYIAELKRDLDRVGQLAKRKLRHSNERTLRMLQE